MREERPELRSAAPTMWSQAGMPLILSIMQTLRKAALPAAVVSLFRVKPKAPMEGVDALWLRQACMYAFSPATDMPGSVW